MVLTHSQARSFYDHFGSRQDAQAFYEDAALDDLIAHAGLDQAERIFEFGCGTGRLALRLLEQHLPAAASYLGIDISQTMVTLARQRMESYKDRADVLLSDGRIQFPLPDNSADRVVSAYVFDLLSERDIRTALAEAERVLKPGGRVCLVCLTTGITLVSRLVSGLWSVLFRLHAPLVGGCRPVVLGACLNDHVWHMEHRKVIVQSGVPSEVLIASLNHVSEQDRTR